MLSVTLFAATLACLVVPPLNVWAGPLLVVLFITNPPVFWSALGLTGLRPGLPTCSGGIAHEL